MTSSPIIMRRKFNYKTRYNLIHLIKELECSLKETCKCEAINTSFFSFKDHHSMTAPSPKKADQSKKSSSDANDSVFLDQSSASVPPTEASQCESVSDVTLENKSLNDEATTNVDSDPVKLQDIIDKQFSAKMVNDSVQVDSEFGNDFQD